MRRLVSIVGWVIALGGVVVLAVEATVRLDDWAQFGVPFFSPASSLGELLVRDSIGAHARPNSQFRQFRVNGLGMRGPEVGQADLSKSLVVVASGASETFGLYEQPGKEWPRQLEDSLRVRCAKPVVVLNAAFAGMSLPTVRQDVALRLRQLNPDVMVYYPTPMQYLEAELPQPAAPVMTVPPPLSPWRFRATARFRDAFKRAVPELLLDQLRQLSTRRARAVVGEPIRLSVSVERLNAYEQDVRGLVGEARSHAIDIVLVQHRHRFRDTVSAEDQRWLRAWERFYPLYSAGAILAFDDSAAARTLIVAADSGVVTVDPQPALRVAGSRAFADFSHFTDAGAAAMGGVVASAVVSAYCEAASARHGFQ